MNSLQKSIVLCGFMASGKTTIGKLLAAELNTEYIDTDDMITGEYGMSIPEIFAAGGEEYFRDCEHSVAVKAAALKPCIISTGGGLLTFERNIAVLKPVSVIICLTRSLETVYPMLHRDFNRPMVYNKSFEEIENLYKARIDKYASCADFIIENNSTKQSCVESVIKSVFPEEND